MTDREGTPTRRDGAKPLWKSALERLGFGGSSTSRPSSPSSKRHRSIRIRADGKASRVKSVPPRNTATLQQSAEGKQSDRDARRPEAWERCKDLAQEPHILDRFAEALDRCGVVGEARAANLIYLALTSRFLDRPISAVLKGPSSGGKSHLADKVLRFFPASAYHQLTGMSERALAYGEEPLRHRFLVVHEASGLAGGVGAYLLRSLISEHRVRYETVEKNSDGTFRTRIIEREGPTGLLLTTTAVRLDAELETRLFSIPIDDSREQTRAVLRALGEEHNAKEPRSQDGDVSAWLALQEALEGAEHRVVVPYAPALAKAIPPVAVRLRRDFGAVLGLVKAHAILHQASRERDPEGRIIATLDDYAVVRDLVADLLAQGVGASVPPTVRETVEAVRTLKKGLPFGAPLRLLAEKLDLDKSSASRRVNEAIHRGYVRNEEKRRGRPALYVPGDPLPEEVEVLPPAGALTAKRCSVAPSNGGIGASPSPTPGTDQSARPANALPAPELRP